MSNIEIERKLLVVTFIERGNRLDMDLSSYAIGKLNDNDANINGYMHGRGIAADKMNKNIRRFLKAFAEGILYSIANPGTHKSSSLDEQLKAEYKKQSDILKTKIQSQEQVGEKPQ